MSEPHWPGPARVILGQSTSNCSVCGGNAMPGEDAHIHGGPSSAYTPGSALADANGCGVQFETEPLNPYLRPTLAELDPPKEPKP